MCIPVHLLGLETGQNEMKNISILNGNRNPILHILNILGNMLPLSLCLLCEVTALC